MITKETIHSWNNDEITVEFKRLIGELKKEIERLTLKGLNPQSQHLDREFCYHLGMLEMADKILEIELIEEQDK